MRSIEWVRPEEVKPVEVSEREIQALFEKNLSDLEQGLEYVHSFVRTPVGVIDTLAIDSEKRTVIFEFKKPENSDRDALIQALDYYAWVADNLPWLNDYVEPEAMLVEYDLRRGATGRIELLPNIIVDTSVTVSRKPSIPKTLDDHFRNKEGARMA